MSDDGELMNRNTEDAVNRLTSALNAAHDTTMSGLASRDVEHLARVLQRAHEALWFDNGRAVKDAIVDEDATFLCGRADEAIAAITGIYLTAERLLKRANDIRTAASELKNAVERSGDDHY